MTIEVDYALQTTTAECLSLGLGQAAGFVTQILTSRNSADLCFTLRLGKFSLESKPGRLDSAAIWSNQGKKIRFRFRPLLAFQGESWGMAQYTLANGLTRTSG